MLCAYQELFCDKVSSLGYACRRSTGNTESKKVRVEKEQCCCAQMFKIKLTNPQTCFIPSTFIYLFSKESKNLLRESPLKMVTEWLGQYVQTPQGSCESDEADKVENLIHIVSLTLCLNLSRDPTKYVMAV